MRRCGAEWGADLCTGGRGLGSQYNNLYLLSVTKRNSNVALMLIFLSRLVNVSKRRANDATGVAR